MSANPPVALTITFTPRESEPPASPRAVRDWVDAAVVDLSPVFVEHTTADGQPTATAYDITSVQLADG